MVLRYFLLYMAAICLFGGVLYVFFTDKVIEISIRQRQTFERIFLRPTFLRAAGYVLLAAGVIFLVGSFFAEQ
jgi:hypothetical protein